MDATLMILFVLFHVLSVGTGKPLTEEKHNIELKINTLMVRLNALPTLPGLTVTPPVELQQFTPIVAALDGYNNLISENFLDVLQVKTDIFNLTNTIIQKLTNCAAPNPELIVPSRLQHLQNVWEQDPEHHVEAVSLEALHGVKEILKLLQDKFDTIESC
uniref:Leptin n=1 Tax=Fundulus heteroclitus TaxID=8078 RepID=A0A3Q2T0D9_FUNHE